MIAAQMGGCKSRARKVVRNVERTGTELAFEVYRSADFWRPGDIRRPSGAEFSEFDMVQRQTHAAKDPSRGKIRSYDYKKASTVKEVNELWSLEQAGART
jgi:hypothetical protein